MHLHGISAITVPGTRVHLLHELIIAQTILQPRADDPLHAWHACRHQGGNSSLRLSEFRLFLDPAPYFATQN